MCYAGNWRADVAKGGVRCKVAAIREINHGIAGVEAEWKDTLAEP